MTRQSVTSAFVGGLRGPLLVLFSLVALVSFVAPAEAASKVRVDFVGFGANPDFYAVVHKDKLAGDSLAVYQIGNPAAVTVVSLEGTSKSKALKSPQVAAYNIQTSGHVSDAKAPQGWTLFGSQIGNQLQVGLQLGADQSTLGYVAVAADPSGADFAKASVSGVHWSADGSRVVVVINQKLGGDWPMDADTLAAYTLQLPAAEADGETK